MRILIISIILFVLFGCDNQMHNVNGQIDAKNIVLSTDEYISIAFDSNSEIPDNKIMDIVGSFANYSSAKSRAVTMNIQKKAYIQNRKAPARSMRNELVDKIPVCEVLIEEQGCRSVALVCTDSRFPFIYAYYEDNKEEKLAMHACDLLIESAEKVVFSRINQIEHLRDSLRTSTLRKVAAELSVDISDVSFEKIKNNVIICDATTTTKSPIVGDAIIDRDAGLAKFGPYINIRWSCGMPYNRNLPQGCPDNWLWDNRYAVSSCVVAIAQILSFYQPSIHTGWGAIDWPYLCMNQEIHENSDYFGSYVQDPIKRREMIGSLMKYIGDQCGVIYNCSGSSVSPSKIEAFLNRFGIKVSTIKAMNLNVLKDGIDGIHPALMYGTTSNNQGHWWIVDGYCIQIATRGDTFFPGFHVYFHANMGQGKSYTGYYLAGSDGTLTFDASFAHFTKNFSIYTLSK